MYPDKVGSLIIDVDRWPVAIVSAAPAIDAEFTDRLLSEFGALLGRNEHFCLLADLTQTRQLRLPEIKKFRAFRQQYAAQTDKFMAALAIATPSAFIRGGIKVVYQVTPPSHPYEVCRSLAEAHEWLDPFARELASGRHAKAI